MISNNNNINRELFNEFPQQQEQKQQPNQQIVPHTFSCWVNYGDTIKDEITFENVVKYNHLKPIIRQAFGITELSPFIQLYSSKDLNSYLEPEKPIDLPNLKQIFIKVSPISNPQGEGEVRVFQSDYDLEPTLTFDSGVDWIPIEKSFHIISGWLKRKGDPNNKRVKNPFPSGDYTLVGSIPLYKTILVVYRGLFGFGETRHQINILFSDSSEDIKRKIRLIFNLHQRTRINFKDENGMFYDISFDLSIDKTYYLVISWSDYYLSSIPL